MADVMHIGGMMFGAIKDSWFFSKTATFAMKEFGIDLMKADRVTDGMINNAVKEARRNNFTAEEAGASCVAISSLAVAEMLDLAGQRPDYSKMHEIERRVMLLAAQGIIREPVQERIEATIEEYYKVMEEKTGVANEYPA